MEDMTSWEKKRIMHIDTSTKLYERKDTAIAYKINPSKAHKGVVLKIQLKKELERDLSADYDYARLYAICIYYLIQDELWTFDILVICGDEYPSAVIDYLNLLFSDVEVYFTKQVIGLGELRELTGKSKLKSLADNIANSYRRRGRKPIHRQQKGIPLNICEINYRMIRNKWEEINNKLKKSVSGA